MNIMLVSIGVFQEYILTNIHQLIRLNHKSIYVITNECFFQNFDIYKDKINLISVESLNEEYNYNSKTTMDKFSKSGFWAVTSCRFFYIYSAIKKYNIENIIHLENDVPIYYNCELLYDILDKSKIYIPFDCYKRNIASIVFIPNANILKIALDNYDYNKTDMENFIIIKSKIPDLIEQFPICYPKSQFTEEEKYVCKNYSKFNMIFDAAAMGQYIGGVDPRNIPGDSTGFVNETCIIKYDQYSFVWKTENEMKKPFLFIEDQLIPIFNLHIHSKTLEKFV